MGKNEKQKKTLQRKGRVLAGALAASLLAAPPVLADPPDWAPAHGWRAKQGHSYKQKDKHYYHRERDSFFRCNNEELGTLLGATAGGAIGSTIGDGSGRTAAIIGGVVLGAILGNTIGRDLDRVDRSCTAQGLSYLDDGQTIRWDNADSRLGYALTPTSTFAGQLGNTCRDYVIRLDGGRESYERTACRESDGVWRVRR
ncbi:glycine zipper 2TM domain-containing protein [Limibacillus halophilus]|jgi:surface antigen